MPPTTSYVTASFHPTIGQRAHQSLSNATTPELGMIPQGTREQQVIQDNQSQPNSVTHLTYRFLGLTQPSNPINIWVSWTYSAKPTQGCT